MEKGKHVVPRQLNTQAAYERSPFRKGNSGNVIQSEAEPKGQNINILWGRVNAYYAYTAAKRT